MSKKKGQLLSEISHNLKQTIKKYNELAIDDNFFNEELNSKSTINYQSKPPISGNTSINNNNYSNINSNINVNPINEDKNNINNNVNNNNNNNEGISLLKINEMEEEFNIIEQHQNNFVSQLNTLMNNLNILEENINKDFDELENYNENKIKKELISKQ